MAWWIVAFNKVREDVAYEISLGEPELSRMQDIFRVGREDHMCAAFPVGLSEKDALEEMTGHHLELERYDYFVMQTADE